MTPQLIRPIRINPAVFIFPGWRWSETSADVDSLALREIDPSQIILTNCMNDDEAVIDGNEKIRRLMLGGNIRLDPGFGVALLAERGQQTLNHLSEKYGAIHFDLSGCLFENPQSYRYLFYLHRSEDVWIWGVNWLPNNWTRRSFSLCYKR